MPLLILYLVLSASASIAAILIPDQSDWLLLSLPCTIASLFLCLRSLWVRAPAKECLAVIDGSNVMHWRDGNPDLGPVRDTIRALSTAGFTPGVVFDANAGYKLEGRYLNDRALSQRLKIPTDRVMVVPKNTPADPLILTVARDTGARVVSRDRFRDWGDTFPEIRQPGFLIKGRYKDAALQLDLPD